MPKMAFLNVLTKGDDYWAALIGGPHGIYGDEGDDELHGNSGQDTIDGGPDNDFIKGNDGDDYLFGGSGDDQLSGGDGFDEMFGGSGNDTLANNVFIGSLLYNIDHIGNAPQDNGGLMEGGSGDDTFEITLFYSTGFFNALTIDGGADTDTIDFEQNFVWVNGPPAGTAALHVDLEAGTASTPFGMPVVISNVENIRGTDGEYRDELLGDDRVNELYGLEGDDFLEGRGGGDRLSGGVGYDVAQYTSASSGVDVDLENDVQGLAYFIDGVEFSNNDAASDVLISIEELRGSRFYADFLRGRDNSGYTERLFGDQGNDTLEGRGGTDTLDGGAGFDLASYESSASAVTVYIPRPGFASASGGDASGDTLVGIEGLIGSAFADTLVGSDAINKLIGLAGNDLLSGLGDFDTLLGGNGLDELYGGGGDDVLDGGLGNDTIDGGTAFDTADFTSWGAPSGPSYSTFSTKYSIVLGQGGADGFARKELAGLVLEADVLRSIEHVTGSGYDETITGNELNNRLDGAGGNDTINGGLGNDIIDGDAGTDTASYATFTTSVTISLAVSGAQNTCAAGTDTLISIENLTGGSGDDTLTGNGGNNVLHGLGGADQMTGNGGNDTYYVDAVGDVVTEAIGGGTDLVRTLVSINALGANIENVQLNGTAGFLVVGNGLGNTITGNTGGNQLRGMAGNDILLGGAGADVILGGTERDQMSGGADADVFHFDAANESGNTAATRDVVTDFVAGLDDLDFATMDANAVLGGNQAFDFRGTAAFSAAGQLRLVQLSGGTGTADDRTVLQANLDDNFATVEFEIELFGLVNLTSADIIA